MICNVCCSPLWLPVHYFVQIELLLRTAQNRLSSLVVRDSGYKSRGPGFVSRPYQIFWEVVGLQRGPFSLMSTTEELLERKNSGSGLEIRECGRRDPLCWPRNTLYPQRLVLTSPTSCGRLVGTVRSRTKATDNSVLIAMNYGLDGGDSIPYRGEKFVSASRVPDQISSPPRLLTNG
jgi:hypothetical protein